MATHSHVDPHNPAVETEVEAKQATDHPKEMPVVMVVSMVAAVALMAGVYAYMF